VELKKFIHSNAVFSRAPLSCWHYVSKSVSKHRASKSYRGMEVKPRRGSGRRSMTDEGSDVMTFIPTHKGRSVEPSAMRSTKTVIHERKHCYPPSNP
jgi:hypothetical protein